VILARVAAIGATAVMAPPAEARDFGSGLAFGLQSLLARLVNESPEVFSGRVRALQKESPQRYVRLKENPATVNGGVFFEGAERLKTDDPKTRTPCRRIRSGLFRALSRNIPRVLVRIFPGWL